MKVNQSIYIPGGVTWANLPAAGAAGRTAFISNAGTKGSFWYDDGTRWKPMGGTVNLASLDAPSSNISNSETIVFQYQMPADLWQVGDCLRLFMGQAKSGTTDTGSHRIRIGTTGTTSDTQISGATLLAAANRQVSPVLDIRLASDTTVDFPSSTTGGYGFAATGSAYPGSITISSASANALYLSVGIFSGGTTNTMQLIAAMLQLISKAG